MQAATAFWIALTSLSLIACGESAQAPETAPAPQATPAPELPAAPPPAEDAAPVEPEPVEPEPAAPAPAEAAPNPAPAAPKAAAPQPAPKATVPAAPVADLAHGQQIYRQACAFCHDKGVAGAPRIGDAAAWSPRLARGMDALYAAAIGGKGAMPAKGGNPALTDADVRAAVDYIAAQSR